RAPTIHSETTCGIRFAHVPAWVTAARGAARRPPARGDRDGADTRGLFDLRHAASGGRRLRSGDAARPGCFGGARMRLPHTPVRRFAPVPSHPRELAR